MLRQMFGRLRMTLWGQQAVDPIGALRDSYPGAAERIACDVGVSPSALAKIAAAGDRVFDLHERMMAEFGLTRKALPNAELATLRKTGVACCACKAKIRCRCELALGTARAHAGKFCPNAAVFSSLAQRCAS